MRRWLGALMILLTLLAAGCSGGGAPVAKTPAAEKPQRLYPVSQEVGGQMLWGYVDESGGFVLEPQYAYAERFQPNGLAAVTVGEKVGLIDGKGETVLSAEYAVISPFSEGLATATQDYVTYDVLDEKGTVLFSAKGLQGSFSEGMIPATAEDGRVGYLDRTGKQVIPAQYAEATAFLEGQALVKDPAGGYLLIDSKGTELQRFPYDSMSALGDGLFLHGIDSDGSGLKWGIVDARNAVILEADFDEITPFQDGYAVVSQWTDAGYRCGLVDKGGNFVLPMEYGALSYLGEGVLAAVKETELMSYQAAMFAKNALIDTAGTPLTEERFYSPAWFGDGKISVSDGERTYLVKKDGSEVTPGPVLEGVGTLERVGDVVYAQVDNHVILCSLEGKPFWTENRIQELGDGVRSERVTRRFGRFILVEYPVISGLADPTAQDRINRLLAEKFLGPYEDLVSDEEYPTDVTVTAAVSRQGGLLEVELSGYDYPLGAAHGTGWVEVIYLDPGTGAQYQLKDLVRPGVDYRVALAEQVRTVIPSSELADVVYPESIETLRENHDFRLTEAGLVIFFQPYEVAPYAAGTPEFVLPWDAVMPLVDTESAFWKAYGVKQ